MNVSMIVDPSNNNFLTPRYKWTPKMDKARVFIDSGLAREIRSSVGKKQNKKLIIQEFELVKIKET